MNTDRHRSEGFANETAVTQRVEDFIKKNLFSSVFICGFLFFGKIQLPDLGSAFIQFFGQPCQNRICHQLRSFFYFEALLGVIRRY